MGKLNIFSASCLAIALGSCQWVPGSDESEAIGFAKRTISERMREPEAVRFRDIRTVRKPTGRIVVCGEVNAKNGYGGYVGYRRFFYENGRVEIEDNSADRSVEQIQATTQFLRDHALICDGIDLSEDRATDGEEESWEETAARAWPAD